MKPGTAFKFTLSQGYKFEGMYLGPCDKDPMWPHRLFVRCVAPYPSPGAEFSTEDEWFRQRDIEVPK